LLKRVPQAQLNVSLAALCRDLAERAAAGVCIHAAAVCSTQIRMVRDVESLGTKLQMVAFIRPKLLNKAIFQFWKPGP
jgi:hypothetical protein